MREVSGADPRVYYVTMKSRLSEFVGFLCKRILNMYICINIYIYIYIYMHINIYIDVYMYMYNHTCTLPTFVVQVFSSTIGVGGRSVLFFCVVHFLFLSLPYTLALSLTHCVPCVAVCCSILQCIALCCSVLQCCCQ